MNTKIISVGLITILLLSGIVGMASAAPTYLVTATASVHYGSYIIVTYQGGPDHDFVYSLSTTCNGVDIGYLSTAVGSTVSTNPTTTQDNRIIVTATFKDGSKQVILDTYLSLTSTPVATPEGSLTISPQKTPRYAPSLEEFPYGAYYTYIEIFTQYGLEDIQKEFALEEKPIYGERVYLNVYLNEGKLDIIELSNLEDAERAYTSTLSEAYYLSYNVLETNIFGDKSAIVRPSSESGTDSGIIFINGKFVVFIVGFDDTDLFTTLAEITDEKLDLIAAPATTPTPTPYEVSTPTPTPAPFASIPPLYVIGAAAVIVIILIAGIGISRKRKRGKSAKPPAEPPNPETEPVKEKPIIKKETSPPIPKSITIERAIYDPCKRDFIEGQLPRMKEWINRYDLGAYWFAMSIQNNTDRAIEEWGVELETSSALTIKEARVEGIDYKIELRETYPEPYKNKYAIGVPKEYGIVIPKGGAQRIYFKLRAEKPKTTYEISGVFKSAIGDVPIRAKEFKYLCDTGVSPEAVKIELKKTFSEKDAARLANTFRVAQEIRSSYCNTDTKAREINKEFDLLKMYLSEREFLTEIENIQRRINAELREDERLDEQHVEAVKEFCEKFTEMWIARFLRE